MRRVLTASVVVAVLTMSGARAADPQIPNLRPHPATKVRIGTSDERPPQRALRFSTSTLNDSAYALDLLGATPRDAEHTRVEQCVGFVGRACTDRRDVGNFVFHAAHGHWHFEDYAVYELRALDAEGNVDTSDAGLVAGGQKVSFCLIDVDPPAQRKPLTEDPFDSTGFYHGCTGAYQGISPRWADTYEYSLPGQQILLDGVADGRYAIVITVNPTRTLLESDYADNTSVQTIEIRGGSAVFPL